MKKILITILFLFPVYSFGAIAHVQTPAGGTDCGSVTSCNLAFGSNVGAGNAIVETCSYGATGRTVTITDTSSSSYTSAALTASNATDGTSIVLGYALNITAGADTVTCAVSGGATTMRFIVSEFSGVATSAAFDQSTTATGTGSTPASGNITPTVNGSLIYAFERNANAADIAAGTDFTLATRVPNSTSARMAAEYYIQPTAAAHNGTFTVSQTNWAAGIASFKPFVANTNTAVGTPSTQLNSKMELNTNLAI